MSAPRIRGVSACRILLVLLIFCLVPWRRAGAAQDLGAEEPPPVQIAGSPPASEASGFRLASVVPDYDVPKGFEAAAMVGTGTLIGSIEDQVVRGRLGRSGVARAMPGIAAAAEVANLASTLHEAASVGLDAGHESMQAELYLLDDRASRMRGAVAETRALRRELRRFERDLKELRGKAPRDEAAIRRAAVLIERTRGELSTTKLETARLRAEMSKLQGDFNDRSAAWNFFSKSVVTDADPETLVRELSIFGREYGLIPLAERFLGPPGGWLFKKLKIDRAGYWTWKGLQKLLTPRLRRNGKAWKRWAVRSRLDAYTRMSWAGSGSLGTELLGELSLPDSLVPTPTLSRVEIVIQRLEARPPEQARAILPERVLVQAAVPLQAAVAVQLAPLAVPARAAPATAMAPCIQATIVPPPEPPSYTPPAETRSYSSSPPPSHSSRIDINNSRAYGQLRSISISGWSGF